MITDRIKQQCEAMGRRLRTLRESKGLSLRDLADKTDIDNSKIGKIEKGRVNITIGIFMELCHGLEVLPKDFFDYDTEVAVKQ